MELKQKYMVPTWILFAVYLFAEMWAQQWGVSSNVQMGCAQDYQKGGRNRRDELSLERFRRDDKPEEPSLPYSSCGGRIQHVNLYLVLCAAYMWQMREPENPWPHVAVIIIAAMAFVDDTMTIALTPLKGCAAGGEIKKIYDVRCAKRGGPAQSPDISTYQKLSYASWTLVAFFLSYVVKLATIVISFWYFKGTKKDLKLTEKARGVDESMLAGKAHEPDPEKEPINRASRVSSDKEPINRASRVSSDKEPINRGSRVSSQAK